MESTQECEKKLRRDIDLDEQYQLLSEVNKNREDRKNKEN